MIDAENVPLLCGRNTMKIWKCVLDMNLETITSNINNKGMKGLDCMFSTGQHLVIPLHEIGDWTTDETVYYMKKEDDLESFEKVKKIHDVTNHKSENSMLHAYKNAGKLTQTVHKSIKEVIEKCNVCQKYKKSQGTPKVALTKVTDFNQIVTLDLKQFEATNVMCCIP